MPVTEQRTTMAGRGRQPCPAPRSSPPHVPQNLRPFCTLDLTSPMLGVASEYIRQLLLEGPVRVKEGREGKVRGYGEARRRWDGDRREGRDAGRLNKSQESWKWQRDVFVYLCLSLCVLGGGHGMVKLWLFVCP